MSLEHKVRVNDALKNNLFRTYRKNCSKRGWNLIRDDKFYIIKELMIEVRDNHTYVNRINFILDFLKKHKNINININ